MWPQKGKDVKVISGGVPVLWPVCDVAVYNRRMNFTCSASLDARVLKVKLCVSNVISFDLACVTLQVSQLRGIKEQSTGLP